MQPGQIHRPVWAEIHLDNLNHNIEQIRKCIKAGTKVCAVVKANGYGHGAVVLAQELERIGVEHLAVATLTEAIELRRHNCTSPILVLGYTPEAEAPLIIKHHLKQTIYTVEQAKAFSDAAVLDGTRITLHIKLDTGMSRLGFQTTEQGIREIAQLFEYKGIEIEGIYTHFATADETDKTETRKQLERFIRTTDALENEGCHIPIKHTANSAGIIDLPETHFDMVRAGVMIYGMYPSDEVNHQKAQLRRIMSLKTIISHVKKIQPGTGVSYGFTFRASKPTTIATLPVGYADGYTRMLTGKAEVTIKGKTVPVVGRICMDQCMVDVTGMDVQMGDEVTLYALDADQGVTVDDAARKLGTINYEITCMVNRRVPRAYYREGKLVSVWDPLLKCEDC